jgi:hypothetical protein
VKNLAVKISHQTQDLIENIFVSSSQKTQNDPARNCAWIVFVKELTVVPYSISTTVSPFDLFDCICV